MTLRERLEKRRRTEATCQGCRQCKWGGIVPCPTQTDPAKLPVWLRGGAPPKELVR